jgi:hypothetical protein
VRRPEKTTQEENKKKKGWFALPIGVAKGNHLTIGGFGAKSRKTFSDTFLRMRARLVACIYHLWRFSASARLSGRATMRGV